MAALIVIFADVNGNPRAEKVEVPDLNVTRPIDVIQVIYNRDPSYRPQQGGGNGTTIWKMGKAVGGNPFTDADSLFDNGVNGNDPLDLRRIDIDVVAKGPVPVPPTSTNVDPGVVPN